MNGIAVSPGFTFEKFKILIASLVISVAIGITIYHAIEKPTSVPTDISADTDIDWAKPPCDPNDLSDDWKEITNPNMRNRRIFTYRDTNIKIAFDKGIPGEPRFRGVDHWHRFNPNPLSDKDLYLDRNGNPTGKNTNSSHIKPCQ